MPEQESHTAKHSIISVLCILQTLGLILLTMAFFWMLPNRGGLHSGDLVFLIAALLFTFISAPLFLLSLASDITHQKKFGHKIGLYNYGWKYALIVTIIALVFLIILRS